MIISPYAFELIYFLQFNISVYFRRRMYFFMYNLDLLEFTEWEPCA